MAEQDALREKIEAATARLKDVVVSRAIKLQVTGLLLHDAGGARTSN